MTDALGSGPFRPCTTGHEWRHKGDATEGFWRTCAECGQTQEERVTMADDVTDATIDHEWVTTSTPMPVAVVRRYRGLR